MKRLLLCIMVLSVFFCASAAYAAPGDGIIINLPSLTLTFDKGDVHREYPVAIGKSLSNTPKGSYKVAAKVKDPTWYPPDGGKAVPPGKKNPLGHRWINFYPGYGIHGNNNAKSIGTLASLGCVRMYNGDVEELFDMVSVGTPVLITYQTAKEITDGDKKILEIYADVYGRGVNSQSSIKAKLSGMGITTGEEKFKYVFAGNKKKTAYYSDGWILTKGDKFLSAGLVKENDALYISADAVKNIFGIDYLLNLDTGIMSINGEEIDFVDRGGKYIDLDCLLNILKLGYDIDAGAQRVDIRGSMIFLNGKFIGKTNYANYDSREIKLPLKTVAEQFGNKVGWDAATNEVSIDDKAVPAAVLNGVSYMGIKELAGMFKFDYEIDSRYGIIQIKR